MFQRYLLSIIILIFLLVSLLIFNNYKNLYKYRDFSYPKVLKIKLIYESIFDTKTDIYRFFDGFFSNKNSIDKIKKIYLDIENTGDLERAQNLWIQKTLLGKTEKNNYFSSNIRFNQDVNSTKKSKFRFRGKSDWHLRAEKPSLRIKLKDFETYNMMKHINLTFPEGRGVVENYYADLISKKLGLIAHYGELVELYINNINYGVYHLHSREDESLIRLNKRMPGPILSGQNLSIDKWNIDDFDIVNLNSISRNLDIFDKMITEINNPIKKIEDWDNIWEILNFEQTAKHVALNTIVVNLHNDYWHNHEFFYDRTLGKIEPIINDSMALGTYVYPRGNERISNIKKTLLNLEKPYYKTPINQKTNPFFNRIISDTRFYHKKNQLIKSFLDDELSFENQSKILNNIYNLIDNAIYRDKRKRYLAIRLNGPQIQKSSNYEYEVFKKNIYEFIKNRNLFLHGQLQKNFLKYSLINLKEFNNQNFILINYKGELPVEIKTLFSDDIHLYNPIKKKFIKHTLEKFELHTALKIVRNNDSYTNTKLGEDIFHDHHYETAYQTYLIKVSKDFNLKIFKKLLNELNYIQSEEIFTDEDLSINEIKFNQPNLHIWSKEYKKSQDIIFDKGNFDIKKDIIVNKNQKLIIHDGVNLNIFPGVSIFSEGQVFINGNNLGVNLKNKFPNQPWGNLSLFGEGTSGSVIKNATIDGGSTKDMNNILFSGMINFFWNKNISLENLTVSNNSIGDDAIHFNKSQGKISNLVVFNCLSDCIDMDYSNYEIKNLNCYDSGNDGLDLMESDVEGFNLSFNKNNDKSISVGEKSNLYIEQITIANSNIGVASKDNSIVNLNKLSLKNSNIGLDSYQKNTRYTLPGKIIITNYDFSNNKLDLKFINSEYINFDYKKLNYIKY